MKQGTIVTSGLLLGAGIGGMLESFVLRHELVSGGLRATVEGRGVASALHWDVLLSILTWGLIVVGFVKLWGTRHGLSRSGALQTLAGALFVGWGLFNFVEGLTMHHVLGLHHVSPGANQRAWDAGFVFSGVLMIVGGWAAVRMARERLMPRESMRPTFI